MASSSAVATRVGAAIAACLTAFTVVLLVETPASAGAGLRARDLGTLRGFCCSRAIAVNDRGDVVGDSAIAGGENPPVHAFLWRHGRMRDLGTLGGRSSFATGVNNRGDVVGYSEVAGGATHAFLWRDGRMRDIGDIPGATTSLAGGINDRGEVTGRVVVGGRLLAFVWRAGVPTTLTGPAGEPASGFAINNRGAVAGSADTDGTQPFPVLWPAGAAAPAEPLGSWPGEANAINRHGDVAGHFFLGSQQAFRWRRGVFTALPSPAGVQIAVGTGINDRADVVGFGLSEARQSALFWPRGGAPVTLRGLSAAGNDAAFDINNRGQIVGTSEPVPGLGDHATVWSGS
jgi:probable HAF family extracellular repeat protein